MEVDFVHAGTDGLAVTSPLYSLTSVINVKAAKALGLDAPLHLQQLTNEVIELHVIAAVPSSTWARTENEARSRFCTGRASSWCDSRRRRGICCRGPVDLDQYLPFWNVCRRAGGQQAGSLKWVNVRN